MSGRIVLGSHIKKDKVRHTHKGVPIAKASALYSLTNRFLQFREWSLVSNLQEEFNLIKKVEVKRMHMAGYIALY